MSGIATAKAEDFEHGTRARYVAGCRCAPCKGSNLDYYHQRQARKREAAPTVLPSGPPGVGVLVRGGREHKVRTCPGAGGAACVRTPAAWLRGKHEVCGACVERATVWNGNVPAAPVREHLLKLRRANVGYKSVADACDVSHTLLAQVLDGTKKTIRSSTAKRVLEVDADARSDGAIAPKASVRRMGRQLEQLVTAGFRKGELAQLLGAQRPALQIGKTRGALVSTVAAVDRLWRRWGRGEIAPRAAKAPKAAEPTAPSLLAGPGVRRDCAREDACLGALLAADREATKSHCPDPCGWYVAPDLDQRRRLAMIPAVRGAA